MQEQTGELPDERAAESDLRGIAAPSHRAGGKDLAHGPPKAYGAADKYAWAAAKALRKDLILSMFS